MPRWLRGLLFSLFVLAATVPGPVAHARLTRLWDAELAPKDNPQDCRPTVRELIKTADADKWGPFRFDCKDGFVTSLYVAEDSRIARDLTGFVKRHGGLFDHPPIELVDAGGPFPAIIRRHGRFPVITGDVWVVTQNAAGGGKLKVIDIYDNLGTNRSLELPGGFSPKVSRKDAESTAFRRVVRRNHPPYSVLGVEAVVRPTCDKSGARSALVWWVRFSEKGNAHEVACFVDALTGKLCEWNGGCTSATDGWQL